jgi:hypothetical protein
VVPAYEDLQGLDAVDDRVLKELDVLVSRKPMYEMKDEYNHMLYPALEYFASYGEYAVGARGIKHLILAKAVTTGRPKGGVGRAMVETRGRIRQVRAGHLRVLVEELFEEIEAIRQRELDAQVAAAAEAARAAAAKANPGVREARVSAVAAAFTAHGGLTDGEARARAEQVLETEAPTGPAAPPPPQTQDGKELGDGADNERRLQVVLRLCAAGYLSKGYAKFKQAGFADTAAREPRNDLRNLHGQRPPPTADRRRARPEAFWQEEDFVAEVFKAPPKERGLGLDAVSYEELSAFFHAGKAQKKIILQLVQKMNAGMLSDESASMVGDSFLYGLEKPDKGTRPIGVGTALRRMAGRCIYAQLKKEFGDVLTTTRPTAAQLRRYGHAADCACNAPLQLGCGTPGGAEIAIKALSILLEANPEYAIASDDKTNGYNALLREAILAGVERFFPSLLPAVEQWYCRDGGLFYNNKEGRSMATDGDGIPFSSREGCTQGDPLGPILWCLAYHGCLLEMQAMHPTVFICAYLDDTYTCAEPEAAVRCMQDGAVLTARPAEEGGCGVVSNLKKQEIYSPTADLSEMPATIKGAPACPPRPAQKYAGGRLKCIKVLGSFVGEEEECSKRLVARVTEHLEPLKEMVRLRDSRTCKVAMQVQLELNRFCANTNLNYFLRAMPLKATVAAARLHDRLIADAACRIIDTSPATEEEVSRAIRQARLPVRFGGLGITSMEHVAPAACLGSWALVWEPMQRLCPLEFAEIDLAGDAAAKLASVAELQEVHKDLTETWRRVKAVWAGYDAKPYDYDKEGKAHYRFHPAHLPVASDLAPLSAFGSTSENLQHAQRTWSSIIHHWQWFKFLATLWRGTTLREAVRFVGVSQPNAGAFLNAVPALKSFRIGSWAMKIVVQRRLGLPLSAAAAEGCFSKHGHRFDAYGDVAANDGVAGHQSRHYEYLKELVTQLRTVWGTRVEYEPKDHTDYSDTRPDLTVHHLEGMTIGDTKLFDSVGSKPSAMGIRGAHVGFGNTLPEARRVTVGLKERGAPGTQFKPATGEGRVEAVAGAYDKALKKGIEVLTLLVEVWGGFSPDLVELLRRTAEARGNKLRGSEYDDTTWSARTWSARAVQRISCTVMRAMAWEIATAMSLPRAWDSRAMGAEGI